MNVLIDALLIWFGSGALSWALLQALLYTETSNAKIRKLRSSLLDMRLAANTGAQYRAGLATAPECGVTLLMGVLGLIAVVFRLVGNLIKGGKRHRYYLAKQLKEFFETASITEVDTMLSLLPDIANISHSPKDIKITYILNYVEYNW